MIKVYIASAYRLGDVAINVKNQLDISDKLMNEGFAPFVPLYSHFHNIIHPRPYKDWIKLDLEWIKSCDCLLRILGDSTGADEEVYHAKKLGIPVFFATIDSIDIVIKEIKKFYE
jgi:hypothetical protein